MNKQSKIRNNTHFSLDDRIDIEQGLTDGLSIREIAKRLSVSPSSISREINRNLIIKKRNPPKCKNINKCRKRDLCNSYCSFLCKNCKVKDCISLCPDYIKADDVCPKGLTTCNACSRKNCFDACEYTRHIYSARKADKTALERATQSRNGFSLTNEQFNKIDEIASPLLKKGQSPYTVINNHPELNISVQTLYRLIEHGELSADNFALRSKLSRKPPKGCRPRKMRQEVISKLKEGHRYEDYLKFMETYDGPVAQMDTVMGNRDEGDCLLTLHLPALHFQMALLLSEHTAKAVVDALDMFETVLGYELFNKVFPVILTDNGCEFTDIKGMERSVDDPAKKRTQIFFCEPNRSDQKGACENNHKYIRYVIPKGTSLKPYVQSDINLMMCHINSFSRKSMYGKTPFALAKEILPEDFFLLTGYEEIPSDQVNLTPNLLKSRISQR